MTKYCHAIAPKIAARFLIIIAAFAMLTGPAAAQIRAVDPNDAIDADLGTPPKVSPPSSTPSGATPPAESNTTVSNDGQADPATPADTQQNSGDIPSSAPAIPGDQSTMKKDDILSAAEGVFGKGAKGLAGIIEDILKKQGQPNGYIVGREGGGAFIVGLRYGSGTLYHKIEGEKPAYWTGPSIGFDAGANAGSTFVLVYNLYDTEDLYKRYPSAEGVAYLVGGFNASYLRRGDVVLIPIRVGAGLRLGANVGYMKFSKKQRWLPF
jgi:hypothetical protein